MAAVNRDVKSWGEALAFAREKCLPGRRVLFVSHTCYLDSSNGASIASRSMMQCLARNGFAAVAMSGTVLESGQETDPAAWLAEQGLAPNADSGGRWVVGASGRARTTLRIPDQRSTA